MNETPLMTEIPLRIESLGMADSRQQQEYTPTPSEEVIHENEDFEQTISEDNQRNVNELRDRYFNNIMNDIYHTIEEDELNEAIRRSLDDI